ncbi:MAG: membrane protein insertion efficiency factor YidD [Pseudomonadota bacterium]|nr:membrane protein insertion efficiency factor YidD [Pseudomonadota bacterium]MEC8978444.1 membrane protein insertion efficiency factor YidD [Pseudomonadota bacterium]
MVSISRIIAKGLICLIQAYQYAIKPYLQPCCRFEPTCSRYAVEALSKHKLHYALFYILRRLLCCQPFSPGGKDPVPKFNPYTP